jgi:hypothetical protein
VDPTVVTKDESIVLWDEPENLGEMGTTNGNSMEFFMKEMDINWKFFTSGQKWA